MTASAGKFAFEAEVEEKAKAFIARYPEDRRQSAVMPLLDLAQRQNGGWLNQAAMDYVADYLSMAPIRVYEVATFYSMYRLKPVGEVFVRVCTTTPCWLRGSDDVVAACQKVLGIGLGETTEDGKFSLGEVECLGACVNAPLIQVGDDYYEDLDGERTEALLEAFKRGDTPTPGPQIQRQTSAPAAGGPTTLISTAENS
jgi:NADH-quinone oxidoreductase subunit E